MYNHPRKCDRGLKLKARALILAVVALTGPGEAATRIWTGTTSGLWSNPANWANGILPIVGDSLEFPDDAKIHEVYNDLEVDFDLDAITIKGKNYVLRGNRIALRGDLISTPNNSTNRILLDARISSALTIRNVGYYNELELAGELELNYYSLVLDTASSILITGGIVNTNEAIGVIQRNSGTVAFGPNGFIQGNVIVEWGKLILGNLSSKPHLIREYDSSLIVGDDTNPPGYARVIWESANKLTPEMRVTVNRSGRLELNGFSQTFSSLSGSGVVDLQSGAFTLKNPAAPAIFGGELRGDGALHVRGVDVGQELSGHNTFTGQVEVASIFVTNQVIINNQLIQEVSEIPSNLILSGSASNAVIALSTNSVLSGNGVARGLVATNGIIRPGPGTLRFLDSVTLDPACRLELQLDGTDASSIQAGSIGLGGANLNVAYTGAGTETRFAPVTANASTGAFAGLPEGAWLLAGDPKNEFHLTYTGNAGHDVVLERGGLYVPPTLRIGLLPAGGRILEWPLAAQGYTLLHADALGNAWSTTGMPPPETNTTDYYIVDDSTAAKHFYRLKR